MGFRLLANAAPAIALAALAGCASPVMWRRPGTTAMQMTMDHAQCEMTAETANPDPGVETVHTGKVGRDIAANLVVDLLHGAAQQSAVNHTVGLCMESKGYLAYSPGAAPPVAPLAAAAPPPTAPPPPVALAAAQPMPLAAAAPAARVAAAPSVPLGPCGETRPCYSETIRLPID